jgi:hypothetical protein
MRSTLLLAEALLLERFEDGTTADVRDVFEPLRDPICFARLRADAEAGTIV